MNSKGRANSYWHQFWFKQVSPAPLCVFRILFGSLVFITSLLLAPDLAGFFGENAVISVETIKRWSPDSFSLFFLLPASDLTALFLFACLLIASLSLCIGFKTRLNAIIVFLCLVSFHNRLPCIFNGADMVLRQQAFLLIFAPSGAMYSIDALFKVTKEQELEPSCDAWPIILLQLQLTAVYCQAFWTKAQCPEWWDGRSIYYAAHLVEYGRLSLPAMFDNLEFCALLGWGTLFIELTLWTLIWFKPTRYFALLLGTLLHIGIESTLSIGLFSYAMISSYALFLDEMTIITLVERLTKPVLRVTRQPLLIHQ